MLYFGLSSVSSSFPSEFSVYPDTFRFPSTVIIIFLDKSEAGFLYVIVPGNLSSSSPSASPIIASFFFWSL